MYWGAAFEPASSVAPPPFVRLLVAAVARLSFTFGGTLCFFYPTRFASQSPFYVEGGYCTRWMCAHNAVYPCAVSPTFRVCWDGEMDERVGVRSRANVIELCAASAFSIPTRVSWSALLVVPSRHLGCCSCVRLCNCPPAGRLHVTRNVGDTCMKKTHGTNGWGRYRSRLIRSGTRSYQTELCGSYLILRSIIKPQLAVLFILLFSLVVTISTVAARGSECSIPPDEKPIQHGS